MKAGEFKAGAAMATLTHAGVVRHYSISPGPPSKCQCLLGIFWAFYRQVELLEKAAGAFAEEDASFEGRSGNPVLEGANTCMGKSGLSSKVAHELLSPQSQQAVGPLEAGQKSKSFSKETWNTEIPAASPKSESAPVWVLTTELPTPICLSA